jgi:hypothetical protein
MKRKSKINTRVMSGSAEDAERQNPGEIDWLALAIADIGGCGKPGSDKKFLHRTAHALGMTHQKVIAILEHGVGHLTFSQVIDIANRARVPMNLLRVGPPDGKHPMARALGAALIEGVPPAKTRKVKNRKAV